ncbi:MAG TPA: hypothetical protein VM430_16755 [Microbacterium sp.]|jgi:uncharacterized protein YukE|nr:hypothetical protein [Microbacterium sp.]
MSVHTFDIAELRDLRRALSDLVGYCQDLEAHAAGATAGASAQWSGVANVAFVERVQTWQIGAVALRAGAESLEAWAGDAVTIYEGSQSDTKGMWATA